MDCSSECTQLLSTQETKNLNIMIPRCVNNLSTPDVDLRAQIVAEHAQTVKYNLGTVTISARYTGSNTERTVYSIISFFKPKR